MSTTNRTRKPRTLPLGTYAEATCKADDRIDALLPELQALQLSKADRATVNRLDREYQVLPSGDRWNGHDEPTRDWTDEQAEQADYILEELCQVAESYLPPYSYLGNLEGDGACFGVWADHESAIRDAREGELWEATNDDGGRYIRTGGTDQTERVQEVPKGQLYVVVSDHGNVSLYQSLGAGKSREIWGVV